LDSLLVQGEPDALKSLLREEATLHNPFLLLVSTAAGGFKRTGPLSLELDMAGEIQVRWRGLGHRGCWESLWRTPPAWLDRAAGQGHATPVHGTPSS
jgi:hypothetical protein